MSIAVIAGLGNPGSKYRRTRHNIGFAAIDAFAQSWGVSFSTEARFEAEIATAQRFGRGYLLVKPFTFVNASGRSLGAILRYRKLPVEALLVIHDDISLGVARSKLKLGGGSGGHNGVADLIDTLGSDFHRFRIGVGAKNNKAMDLADFVLGRLTPIERAAFNERMPVLIRQIETILKTGPQEAMNLINQRNTAQHERNE